MPTIRLRGSGAAFDTFDVPLVSIDVTSDTAEEWGPNRIRRTINGTITETSDHWESYLAGWRNLFGTRDVDGKPFVDVKNVQIDFDHYGFTSLISVDNDQISILAVEGFGGSMVEYYEYVQRRNQSTAEIVRKWTSGQITRNDIRVQMGLVPKDEPFFNQTIGPERAAECKENFLDGAHGFNLRTNLIV